MNGKTSTRVSEPIIVTMSVLGALQMFLATASGVSYFNDSDLFAMIFALATAAVAASMFGVQFYVRGQVVPLDNVVEFTDRMGSVVAGPANDMAEDGELIRAVGVPDWALEGDADNFGTTDGEHGATH